jgi:hypothetical protein
MGRLLPVSIGSNRPKAAIKYLQVMWLIALTGISINALHRRIKEAGYG